MTVTAMLYETWLLVWVVAGVWLACLLVARAGFPRLASPWRGFLALRRRHRLSVHHVDTTDADGFARGTDGRGRDCYLPAPGIHVYGVGHRHPISGEPRVCVRRLDGRAVFCDRAGRTLRRLPAGVGDAQAELYLPFDELSVREDRFTTSGRARPPGAVNPAATR